MRLIQRFFNSGNGPLCQSRFYQTGTVGPQRQLKTLGINIGTPHLWHQDARAIKRKIVLHIGPTNSGKTFQALKRLLDRPNRGLYLGPLRLLAWEVCEKIRKQAPCILLTGQEVNEDGCDADSHKSCTVEMADLQRTFDVAVLDEAQLLGDDSRGWAWTNAFLGVQCKELHVCGSENVQDIIERLVALTGDEIVERNIYQRLSPLEVSRRALENYGNIQPGDCVVAFQRTKLYQIKKEIERLNPEIKCCVVYGGLPPETRRAQASLFSDTTSGFNVLVASDAIGMGLNLAIRRVIFSELRKFDGRRRRALFPAEIKQIAGRAGRFGVPVILPGQGGEDDDNGSGIVTSLSADSLPAIRSAVSVLLPKVRKAGLFPSLEQLELLGIFQDYRVTRDILVEFWLEKLHREWDITGTDAQEQAKRLVQDSSSASAILKNFGGAGAFARELELFLHDFEGLSVDDEEKKVDDEGSKDAPPVRSRLERVDRLRKRYGSSLEHSSGGMRAPLSVGLAKLLELFKDSSALDESDDTFFLCALDERVSLASLLDGISPRISFRNKYTICMAPVGRDDDELKDAFFRFASSMAVAKKVRLKAEIERVDWVLPRSPERVLQIEQAHKTFDLYLWLGQRFPEQYPDMPAARECAERCSSLISDALMNMSDDSRRRVPRVDGQGRRRGRGKGRGGRKR